MQIAKIRSGVLVLARMIVLPSVLYLALFCLLTYPLIARFSTHLFGDEGDGLQNVWNIWWVNHAVVDLRQSPWFTRMLRYPDGVTLLGHTLTAFNGFMAIPLLTSLTLSEAYNVALVFTFVAGGVTAFLLAYRLVGSYRPSLLAGFIYTFSNYHFAHTDGHLNLSSIEWIPLFVLLWYTTLLRPRIVTAAGAAVAMFLVLLCDYNFFFYCLLTGLIMFCWNGLRLKDFLFFVRRESALPLGAFVLVTAITSGSLVFPLLSLNRRDPLVGGHEPRDFSMDVFGPFIPGGHWRFADLTKPYWSRLLTSNPEESSVHLGLSVVFLLIYAHRNRKRVGLEGFELWFFLLVVFAVLSLGPQLQILGKRIRWTDNLLPYAWLEFLVPPLKVSGVPVRMAIMMTLGAALIAAGGVASLLRGGVGSRLLALVLLAVMVVEYLPKPITATVLRFPRYVEVLRELPGGAGVWDAAGAPYKSMFHQIHHRKPIAFGYLPRVPTSVHRRDVELKALLKDRRYDLIWQRYRIKYLAIRDVAGVEGPPTGPKLICRDGAVSLFDLAPNSTAREVSSPAEPVAPRIE